MKRFLSIFFALVLFSTLIPFHAFAAETDTAEYNRVIDLACEVFPEYICEITNTSFLNLGNSRSSAPSIVHSETRIHGEDTIVTYSMMSDGAVILGILEPTDSLVITNSSGVSGATTYIATLTLALTSYQGVFKAENVMFTVAGQLPDLINSPGTLSGSNLCSYSIHSSSYVEDSSPASVKYQVCFYRGDFAGAYQHIQFYYTLYVGGNTWWTTVTQ